MKTVYCVDIDNYGEIWFDEEMNPQSYIDVSTSTFDPEYLDIFKEIGVQIICAFINPSDKMLDQLNFADGVNEMWEVIKDDAIKELIKVDKGFITKFPRLSNKHTNVKKALSFVLTGKFSKSKNEMVDWIKNSGHVVLDRITYGVDYLVQADPNSQSNKTKMAQKLGIKVIDEVTLSHILK